MKKMILIMAFLLPAMFIFAQNPKETAPQKSTKSEISPSKLPKTVTDYINSTFPGAKITKAVKTENDAEAMYNVTVDLKGKAHSLIFNKEGKFMKMGEEKVGTTAPAPKATPPAQKPEEPKK